MADLIAVAIEKRDREIALRAPIALGFLEGGKRQDQHGDGADGAPGHAFAEDFEHPALPTAHTEPAEEDGDILHQSDRRKPVFHTVESMKASMRSRMWRLRGVSPAGSGFGS